MQNNVKKDLWLSRIGCGFIFCYCFVASILYSYFAQIHLTLSFLPFPIFISEILLFICLMLFCGLSKDRLFSQRSVILLSLYFGWVLVKALINYYYDGPLTFRNAALFYYPVFAVFAYCFYQKANISRHVLMLLALWAAGIMFFKIMIVWYWWTYVTLFVIAVWNTKSAKLRWVGWAFLVIVFLLGKEYFYEGPRAHFVSVFGAVLFMIFYFGAFLIKRRAYVRLSILLVSFVLFIMGFFVFSNRNDISSVTSLKEMINAYKATDKRYQAMQVGFVPEKLSVHLYNPKKFTDVFSVTSREITPSTTASNVAVSPQITSSSKAPEAPSIPQKEKKYFVFNDLKNMVNNNILSSRIRDGREFDLNEINIVFRLFVWRDMYRELVEKKAWWGFSFGHPQRSISLEVLHWAESEWRRDGWITPHNSFFHVIYRSGILGIIFIGAVFFMISKLIKDFFHLNSIEGGLLIGALVYWVVLSNFFVILEFPYNAIVFWTLFGITMAYRDGLKEKELLIK